MKAKTNQTEKGSALMLVPAGVLVLVMLGAMAVDSSLAFMAKRELQNDAAGAVNDAVAVAISQDDVAVGGSSEAELDLVRVEQFLQDRLVRQSSSRVVVTKVEQPVVVDGELMVTVHGEVDYLFASAVPGAKDVQAISVQASAELR